MSSGSAKKTGKNSDFDKDKDLEADPEPEPEEEIPEIVYQFQPGDSIVPMSQPFLKVLHLDYKGRLCDNCFEPGGLRRCNGCHKMHYCGKVCQKQDWKAGHSVECKSETFKNPAVVGTGILVDSNLLSRLLRTLAKFHLAPESFDEKHLVHGTTERSLNDILALEPTHTDHQQTASFLLLLSVQLKSHDSAFGAANFDEEFLMRALGVWKRSGFTMFNANETNEIGGGIYIAHSAIKHGCRPNAIRVCKAVMLEIRCIHPIPEGEQPLISFLPGNRSPEERKAILKARFKFDCTCELCKSEESGPLVDYGQLESYSDKLIAFQGQSYRSITVVRDRGLAIYRKLYHEYDEPITDFYIVAFNVLHEWQIQRQNVPKTFIRKEAFELEKRLRITYGKGSTDYERFQRKLNELGIELGNGKKKNNL